MKNKFLLLLGSITLSLVGFSQNKAWILAPNYHHMNSGGPGPSTSLPTPTGGYNGAPATSAQNIQMDANNEILFFIVDGKIYGKNGILIDEFADDPGSNNLITGENSELVVIPDRDNCEIFHLIGARYINPSEHTKSFYARLRIVYNAQGNISTESGLIPTDPITGHPRTKSLYDYVGTDFQAINADNQERASYAVIPDIIGNGYKIFIMNGTKIFRFSIQNENFTYDNYFINYLTFVGINLGGNTWLRKELEAVRLNNGNIRLGIIDDHFDNPSKLGAIVIDATSSGTFITGSQKICGYLSSSITFPLIINTKIGGIEFSPDGNKLFITHQKFNPTNSTLDYWDLSGPTPIKHELSTLEDLSIGQVELAKDGNIYIPRQNYLAKISSLSATPIFNSTAVNIGNYLPASGPNANNKLRLLQDQIDGSNVTDNISPNTIHAITYNVTTSATWNGSSPIAPGQAIINIEKELRIKAGTNLTIKDMTIRFAPGARLVVENGVGTGQSAKLILQNSTLTNFVGCGDEPDYWLGVEVWGNSTMVQNNISNTTQGVFRMNGNSKIEYAINGVLLSKRNEINGVVAPESYSSTNNGGIVQAAENATFLNCMNGILFGPYNVGTTNVSSITYSLFNWDDNFIQSKKPGGHIVINSCTDIRIVASKFYQNATHLYPDKNQWGIGVFALNSSFSVLSKCSTLLGIGQDCPNESVHPSEFKNLRTGVFTWNINNKPFTVLRNEFVNCVAGVSSQNAKNQIISRNNFKIHEDNNMQTWGIFISNGDKYKVEENSLSAVNGIIAQNYGIIIDNSGELHNELYKNKFTSLLIGTQAQLNNGKTFVAGTNNNASGLRYNCNIFLAPINTADIAVASNGKIDYEQGRQGGATVDIARNENTARNSFSYTGNGAHDILLGTGTHQVTYYHLGNPNHRPLTITNNAPIAVYPIHQEYGNGNYLYSDNKTCLTRYPPLIKVPGTIVLRQKAAIIDSLSNVIDNGKTSELLSMINSNPLSTETHEKLQNASPYLSDTILKTYIYSSASNSKVKEILIANSQLSKSVMTSLEASARPRSLANDLIIYQSKLSAQQAIYKEISLKQEELYFYQKEYISYLYNDTSIVNKNDSLILYLNEFKGDEFKKELLSIYSELNDGVNFNRVLEEYKLKWSQDLVFCLETTFELDKTADWKEHELDSLTLNSLTLITESSKDEEAKTLAASILSLITDNMPELVALPIITESRKAMTGKNDSNQSIDLAKSTAIQLYPNPSTGIIQMIFSELPSKSISIQISDLLGKVMYEHHFENTTKETIDLTHLKKGTYLVAISIDGLKSESNLLRLE